jgi:hypothetical protein
MTSLRVSFFLGFAMLGTTACSAILGDDFDNAFARQKQNDGGSSSDADTSSSPGTHDSSTDGGPCVTACNGVDGGTGETDVDASFPEDNGVTLSAATYYACAIRTDGTVACWGSSGSGGATPPEGTFRSLSTGGGYSCGVKTDGSVACWGYNASTTGAPPAGSFRSVSADNGAACGVRTDGAIECWGFPDAPSLLPGTFRAVALEHAYGDGLTNFAGRIGTDGAITYWAVRNNVGAPAAPTGSFLAVSISDGYRCTLDSKRAIACSGATSELTPPTGAFRSLSTGRWHACAIKLDDTLACFGHNQWGESTPPSGAFRSVAAGESFTCAVKMDGTIVCWGEEVSGRTTPPTGTFL